VITGLLLSLEDGDGKYLRNVGKAAHFYTMPVRLFWGMVASVWFIVLFLQFSYLKYTKYTYTMKYKNLKFYLLFCVGVKLDLTH